MKYHHILSKALYCSNWPKSIQLYLEVVIVKQTCYDAKEYKVQKRTSNVLSISTQILQFSSTTFKMAAPV